MFDEVTARQKKLLWIVVQEYVETALPVGSEAILSKYSEIDCSPATVRKELLALESMGFLMHPHTSAGRIPTSSGYRFYIDNLMMIYRMTSREKTLVKQFYDSLNNDLDSIMERTVKTINSISNYAAVLKTDNDFLAEITGIVKQEHQSVKKESVYLTGLYNLLFQPEFEDLQKVRKIAGLLEEKERFSKILDEYADSNKTNITIGEELLDEDLIEYSLVTKCFHYKGELLGQIGVLGPKRMQYSRVAKTIETIATMLDEYFYNL